MAGEARRGSKWHVTAGIGWRAHGKEQRPRVASRDPGPAAPLHGMQAGGSCLRPGRYTRPRRVSRGCHVAHGGLLSGGMSDDLSKSVHVRLPPDLLERLRADAEANGRTVAQTIRFLLGRAFDGS